MLATKVWMKQISFSNGLFKAHSRGKLGCRPSAVLNRRAMATLSIKNPHDLVDNPWKISIAGLLPGQKVTLRASLEESNMRFGSHAHFIASQSGEITLDDAEAVGGTYTGRDNMGLMWSMIQSPGQRAGLRLAKRDVTTPYSVTLSLYNDHWSEEGLYQSDCPEPLTSQLVHRWYLSEDVRRSEIREGNIRGTLFTPPGPGPFRGVIDLFGTAGGQVESRAALLASRGFKVLALPYFGYQDLPKTLMDVDFTYFVEAVEWFSSLPDVAPGGIGAFGVSKGGEIALWMAVHCPQVSAVVNISGAPFLAMCPMKFGSHVLPGMGYDFAKIVTTEDGTAFGKALLCDESAFIPIQWSKAKVLAMFGEDDQMIPVDYQYRYLRWLPEAKRGAVELVVFPDTGHLIEPPYAAFCGACFHILLRNTVMCGGKARSHAHSEVIAWNKLLGFLRQNVGQIQNTVPSQL